MKEYTIIFIGKSGSGKGTQISMLRDYFLSHEGNAVALVESGQGLRDFLQQDTYTSKLAKLIPIQGKLIPTPVAIWSWVDAMIKKFTGQNILFVDGAPRKLSESFVIDEMFDFYERKNRYVINIDVSDEWTRERLKHRGRGDDISDDSVNSRLEWFRKNSPEIIDFFEKIGKYKMVTINGEQSVENVQRDILKALEV